MAQIKSYTDIEQSKKLAEILPFESADMDYIPVVNTDNIDGEYSVIVNTWDNDHIIEEGWIPCWSLTALLGVLPTINDEFEPQLHRSLDKYRCTYEGEEDSSGLWRVADNPVDACVAMIEKLNELNLL